MMPCRRPDPPPLLAEHGEEVGRAYAARRATEPAYRFSWPQRGGRSLRDEAHDALVPMTAARCAYCDAYPIGASGRKEVDHFRPKGDPRFYLLVCAWDNLFLACTACNATKREQWDDALLRPDDPDYAFERYFYPEADGRLIPAPSASPTDQHRAARTIEILGLNDGDKIEARRIAAGHMRRAMPDELGDFAYRFLLAIVRS